MLQSCRRRCRSASSGRPASGGPQGYFVQCNQLDCQYVDENKPPCPLHVGLFADEIRAAEEAREHARSDPGPLPARPALTRGGRPGARESRRIRRPGPAGMAEAQAGGVQAEPPQRIAAAAVVAIAEHRDDRLAASCARIWPRRPVTRRQLQPRGGPAPRQHAIVRDGLPAAPPIPRRPGRAESGPRRVGR